MVHLLLSIACAARPTIVAQPTAVPGPGYVVLKLGHGPDYVPGTSDEIAAMLGTCGTAVIAAQRSAWASYRNNADKNGLNCSAGEATSWTRNRLAAIADAQAAGRPDLVPSLLGEAVEAVQSVAFQSNLVETLAKKIALGDLTGDNTAFWQLGYSPTPTELLSQYRADVSPNRCTGAAPELSKRTSAASSSIPEWGISGHLAAVRVATEATHALMRQAAKAAPTWAGSCESFLVAELIEEEGP